MSNIVALVLKNETLIAFRAEEISVQGLLRARRLEAKHNGVPIQDITLQFEGTPTVEQKRLLSEDFLKVKGGM